MVHLAYFIGINFSVNKSSVYENEKEKEEHKFLEKSSEVRLTIRILNLAPLDGQDTCRSTSEESTRYLLRRCINDLPSIISVGQVFSLHPNFSPSMKIPDGVSVPVVKRIQIRAEESINSQGFVSIMGWLVVCHTSTWYSQRSTHCSNGRVVSRTFGKKGLHHYLLLRLQQKSNTVHISQVFSSWKIVEELMRFPSKWLELFRLNSLSSNFLPQFPYRHDY